LPEGEGALHDRARLAGRGLDPAAGIELLAISLFKLGLVIERVTLADAAVHGELDDALGLGGVVETAIEVRAGRGRNVGVRREQAGLAEQVGESDPAEA